LAWTTAPAELLVLQEADGGRSAGLYQSSEAFQPDNSSNSRVRSESLAGPGDSFVTRENDQAPGLSSAQRGVDQTTIEGKWNGIPDYELREIRMRGIDEYIRFDARMHGRHFDRQRRTSLQPGVAD
jgi:hypothetical protein